MTSYELLDFYQIILEKMEELEGYTKDISNLVEAVNKYKDAIMLPIYSGGFKTEGINVGNAQRGELLKTLVKFTMDFDILKNHQKLLQVQDRITTIFNNANIDVGDEKDRINDILQEFLNVTQTIYEYVKLKDNSIIAKLINEATIVVNKYYMFVESYITLKKFMLKTENNIKETENEKTLKLYFYDEHLKIDDFIFNLNSVHKSYEIMCVILNISSSESELKVVKIESGSLFEKFIGCESVIDALAFIVKKTTELVFNKFTLDGKIMRHKQLLDLMKDDAEVITKYKELGFDMDFAEEDVIKNHYMLIKSIQQMISRSTKIKINDEEIYLKETYKQKYLSESSILLLEHNASEDNNEQE